MPAITPIFATNFVANTGDETAFTDSGCETSALQNGVDYLVFFGASVRNDTDLDYGADARIVHGSTELCSVRANETFVGGPAGAYGGYPLTGVVVVTGNGTDTLRLQRRRVGGAAADDVSINGQYIYAIPLSAWADNIHYFYGENASPLVTTAAAGFEGVRTVQFVAPLTGTYSFITSCQYDSTAGADELNVRVALITDPDGAATPTIMRGGQLTMRELTGLDISNTRHVFQAALVQGQEYAVDIQVDAVASGSIVDLARTFVFAPGSLGDGGDSGQVYAQSTAGFTVVGAVDVSGNALVTASAPGVGDPNRQWLLLGDVTKKVTFWSQERVEEDPNGTPTLLSPISGFGANDIGTGADDDLLYSPVFASVTLTSSDADTQYVINSEGLGGGANNLMGVDAGSTTGTVAGEALLAIWLYAPDAVDVSATAIGTSSLDLALGASILLFASAVGASQLAANAISINLETISGQVIGTSVFEGDIAVLVSLSGEVIGTSSIEALAVIPDLAIRGSTWIRIRDRGDAVA